MKRPYSLASLIVEGLSGHAGWGPAWRDAKPKAQYKVVVVGGGGHGLATAYYLAKTHRIRKVAVLEKGWIGGGNTGRNTTIVRSNYYYRESAALYDMALGLYEGLSEQLNFNIMLSQRGLLTLGHSRQEMEALRRWAGALKVNGIDGEMIDAAAVAKKLPLLGRPDDPARRFPVLGGLWHRRGGVARHDAVAWAYARAADFEGVDIVQNCPVTGFVRGTDGKVTGVETPHGTIAADTVVLAAASGTSQLAEMAGFRLPLTPYTLQAFVTEPVKPVLDTVVMSQAMGVYVSQSDKGELVIGGPLDMFQSHGQRGNLPVLRHTAAGILDLFPSLSRLRMLRQWGGTVDVAPDSSPILGAAPVPGLVLNCGWGTGGFKAIPAGGTLTAHHVAKGEPHPIAAPFGLDRFARGALIDEAAAAGFAH